MTSLITAALVLQLHNLAGAPPPIVETATVELTRAYRAAGITGEWRPSAGADASAVRVVLLPGETGALRLTDATVMGAATRSASGSSVVYIFYERVRAEAERYAASTPLVLACAIEHELGHVLMPEAGHSRDGLMRACWRGDEFRRADQGQLWFSAREAALIRERLGITSRESHLDHGAAVNSGTTSQR